MLGPLANRKIVLRPRQRDSTILKKAGGQLPHYQRTQLLTEGFGKELFLVVFWTHMLFICKSCSRRPEEIIGDGSHRCMGCGLPVGMR
jgi:hypothetical protein